MYILFETFKPQVNKKNCKKPSTANFLKDYVTQIWVDQELNSFYKNVFLPVSDSGMQRLIVVLISMVVADASGGRRFGGGLHPRLNAVSNTGLASRRPHAWTKLRYNY